MRKSDSRRLYEILSITDNLMIDFYDKHSIGVARCNSGDTIAIDLADVSGIVKQLAITGMFIDKLLFKCGGVALHSTMMITLGDGHVKKSDIPSIPKIRLSKNDIENLIDLHKLIGDIIIFAKNSGIVRNSKWLIGSERLFHLANSITGIYLKN